MLSRVFRRAKHKPGSEATVDAHRAVVPTADGIVALRDSGAPLDRATRVSMESRIGHDFSRVRVHADGDAAAQARVLGARAFTAGEHVFFATGAYQPQQPAGRRLMAHELTHVVQQRQAPPQRAAGVQCRIVPEDVAVEMIGREFSLAADHVVSGVTLRAGTLVTALTWSNTSDSVLVTGGGILGAALVPKTLLRPTHTAVAGVAPYSAGVAGQAAAVTRAEAALAAWMAQQASYRTTAAVALFNAERTRLESLLRTKQAVLNRRLIQETMFNRFDAIIKREVDAANTAHGLTGADALDANLVKSMLFQESQLGTAGEHLEVPASHPVKTRFNLGQVIDSSGMALLTLLETEQPAVIAAFLPTLRADLVAAQNERAALKQKTTLTATESARLATLDGLAAQNWEVFIWSYRASGLIGLRFADVVAAFFGATAPARNLDYQFWIHMAVMWLFEKHTAGRSWPATIKAYNGSGARASHYRDAVVRRAADAAAAASAGTAFVPGGI
jgi:hypothetical protein